MRFPTYTIKIVSVLCAVLLLLSTVGAYAAWNYFIVADSNTNMPVEMAQFYYLPEEILPDTEEDIQLGTNHAALIEAICNDSKYGINRGNIIPNALADNGI